MMSRPLLVRVVGDVAYVKLNRGYEAVIDAEDIPLIEDFTWHAHVTPKHVYVASMNRVGGKNILTHMQRLIRPSKGRVFFKNGNPLDCRKANIISSSEARLARLSLLSKSNKSGFKGVIWRADKKKWTASAMMNGVKKHLGYFASAEEAHAAVVAFMTKINQHEKSTA
jgi:hypothetical protein